MKNYLKRTIGIFMAAMMMWSSMDVNAFAAVAEAEDSIQNDQIEKESSGAVGMPDDDIAALGSKPNGTLEVTSIGGGSVTPVSDNPTRVVNDIDLRTADYIKVVTAFSADDWAYYVGDTYLYLIDASTGKNIKPCIHHRLDDGSYITFTDYFRRGSGEIWNYGKASIGLGLEGNFKYVKSYKLQSYSIGYASYNFKVDDNYNHMGEYRERVFTGEDRYEPGKLVEYPKPYFTDGNGKHVEEKQFVCGQTVSASVWEGGGTNSQGVKADGNTVICRGFKLAKPGKTNELSEFITTGGSFTFDQSFLSKYKDYLSSDGTFTLVPVYEPKYQAVQFFNGYAAVDGKANVKGVYDGFRSDYTQNATKLDTIRVSAKANSDYRISHLILQSPTGAYYNKSNRSDKWTGWRTRSDSQSSDDPTTLEAAINYKGDMWNSGMTKAILGKNLCRVLIYYGDAATGSITMAPSPQSVKEGADGKLTFIQGPGAENDPNLGKTVDAGGTIKIDNVQLFKPYIFGAKPKSGFHAYWKDGTLDTNGDGSDDIRIPGYEPFRNTFGDQFKFIPQVPAKNKVYYNFVKDVNVAKEVKSLPIKGYLLLNDQLLISGKKVQKGLSGITAFASGFKAGQEVTTDENGYYVLESNDRFKYYDLYDYNVTFTGESEAGTIGVLYSQNPNKLGNVVVDATADADITDVKLLIEQNKKDGSGKEYVTVDTSDAMLNASGGYYTLPGGDKNYRLQMSAHRGNEVLAKGVITFTNTNGKKVAIEGKEDESHSGLFTFDFNPKAKGITGGATARVAFYVGDRALLSRDAGLKVADGIGSIRIINPLTGSSSVQPLGVGGDALSAGLAPDAGQPIIMDWSGDFDDITDNFSAACMDGQDRVICVGFGRNILSAGGEKDMLMDLARAAAKAQDEGGEAADKAQSRLDDKIKAIQNEYRQQAKFDDSLSMDLGYSMLMTFGYDEECGKWYFKDMLCTASVDADSVASENLDTGLGLSAGIGRHLKANGRCTIVVEERQDLTDEGRKEKRYYITEENKDSFDILSVAGSGENRRFDSYGRLDLDPEITLTGFSSFAGDLVQTDVDGKAEYDLAYGASADSTGTCAQNASVKLRIMNYSDTIPILNGVYQTGKEDSNTASVNALGAGTEDCYLFRSADTLEPRNLSYMEGEDTWYGEWNDAETTAAEGDLQALGAIDDGGHAAYSESMLANRIAPDAGYDMVSLGDGKFAAVFLNVPQSRIRDSENAKAAYYTYYDGSKWSEPEILEDDGTLDLYPHIYSISCNGAMIMWSSVNEEYKDSSDRIERQNALDLHGRFVNKDGSLDESIIKITETVVNANGTDGSTDALISDFAADKAIGVSQSGDKLVIAYEKRAYKTSGAETTVGDMLYPESCRIGYRTYALATGGFESGPDDGNAYGQKFYDGYLPEVELQEDLDETGYYREGGTGTKAVKLDDPGSGMLLDSDMATFSAGGKTMGVLAYTVDTDGNLGTAHGRDLYLATYDFETDSFGDPIILTGCNVNADEAGTARSENSSPEFAAASDGLYLMWLKDGNIVSMNVTNLLKNEDSLIKEGTEQGITYRYADKTPYSEGMTAAYEAPVTLVSGVTAADADDYQTGAISAFDAETDGRYIYVIWPQAADDKPEKLEDGLKDIQMWGIRTEVIEGAVSCATNPVQITSHYGERYDDVAFGVYDGAVFGLASKIPSRMITGSEAREIFAGNFNESAFVPYAIWDDTGTLPVAFKISGSGASRIKNAGFTGAVAGGNATFSLKIHNYSFNDLNGAKVTAVDKDGNRCTLYRYVPSETEDTEGETTETDEITVNGLRGGDAYVATGSLPIAEDAGDAEVTILLKDADGNLLDYTSITAELVPDITLQDISISETGARNIYQVTGRLINEGTARSDAGVINLVVQRGSSDKTLRQIDYPALMPGESYEFDEENENDKENESDAYDDGDRYVLIEVSDDDFTVTNDPAVDNGASDDLAGSTEYVTEELQLYAVYSGGMGRLRIPVQDATRDTDFASSDGFITRSVSESALEDIGYVTGVQACAVKAAEDADGYLTGEVVSNSRSQITLEAGETVDIQAEILTGSPRKGAQATFDQNDKLVAVSTGTEGLTYHYEYIGDNAEINTDGILHAIRKGTGRIRVYVYPDNSVYTADNDAGDNTVVIDGEEFQSMDVGDSFAEDAFHSLPSAAIKTFILDVDIVNSGERTQTADPSAVNGILYRILNATDAAVCGLEENAAVKTLTIPATVTIDGKKYNVAGIDPYAFHKSLSIEKLSIGKNVTSMGSGSFEGCENLSRITLGSALTQIGESAFKGCTKISAVTLPSKLERIDAEAFSGCAGLKNLVIPASVTYIGDKAFAGCTGLLKISVRSDKLTGNNLGSDVFLGVPQNAEYSIAIKDAAVKNELTDTLTNASDQVTDRKGITYSISSKADKTLAVTGLTDPAKAKFKSVSIPAKVTFKGYKYTVTAIADGAFENNETLSKVTIPKTVTSIGERAFAGAASLKSAAIPAAVKTLGAEAYSGCVKLGKVTIASPDLTVGDEAFNGVPDTAVFKYSFKGEEAARKLRGQLLSQSTSFVSKAGLKYELLDPELTVVLLTGSADKNIKKLNVPDTVTYRGAKLMVVSVQDGAFAYHEELNEVVLGKNVFEICPDAFAGCTSLKSVTMKGIKNIFFGAFTGCTGLKSVKMPKTAEAIDGSAFKGCISLDNVTIQSESPSSLKNIGADAFRDISERAVFKIQAKPADKETIKTLLIEAGVDPERIK